MRKIKFEELSDYTVPARGAIDKIYLHWTAGHYGQFFGDYHLNIDADGSLHTDMDSFMDLKAHTWRRNSRAIGISLCCCYGASIDADGNIDYGSEPPTQDQLDMMAKVVAKLCVEIGIYPEGNVWTHAEVADFDGYGIHDDDPDMRWDLYGLGWQIRQRVREYINEWSSEQTHD